MGDKYIAYLVSSSIQNRNLFQVTAFDITGIDSFRISEYQKSKIYDYTDFDVRFNNTRLRPFNIRGIETYEEFYITKDYPSPFYFSIIIS